MSLLLKVCYNDQEDLPVDLELTPIAELLRACGKYQMIRIEDLVRAAWNKIAISRPLEAFFVAICQGLDDCARAAAKNVLSGPIPDAYTPVMESAPALAYHRLLVYYDACRAVRKERLVAFKNRIPSSFYVHDRGRFFSDGVQKAIHEFAEGTHGVAPHMGYPKHALPNVLTNAMSTNSTLRRSQVWEFIEILVEGVTSVPDVVAAAIDEVRGFSSILRRITCKANTVLNRSRLSWPDLPFFRALIVGHGTHGVKSCARSVEALRRRLSCIYYFWVGIRIGGVP